jgi:hypothetical protein
MLDALPQAASLNFLVARFADKCYDTKSSPAAAQASVSEGERVQPPARQPPVGIIAKLTDL